MTDADALNLIARYEASWFKPGEAIRSVSGARVPHVRGRELVTAMIENVADSRRDLQGTADRLRRARLDGLLDRDAFAGVGKETKARWIAAVNTVRGDYVRARSELAHWQEYAEWANAQADAEPVAADPRLPPEREEEVPF